MIQAPTLLKLPIFSDPRGNLTFLENGGQLPFVLKRVYWTYDVPGGDVRGGHAYKEQHELIIALSGSFDVIVSYPDNSDVKYTLNRSFMGLYLPPKTWRHIHNFSTNALSLHLSSHEFSEEDYLRDFEHFKTIFYEPA